MVGFSHPAQGFAPELFIDDHRLHLSRKKRPAIHRQNVQLPGQYFVGQCHPGRGFFTADVFVFLIRHDSRSIRDCWLYEGGGSGFSRRGCCSGGTEWGREWLASWFRVAKSFKLPAFMLPRISGAPSRNKPKCCCPRPISRTTATTRRPHRQT